MKNKLAPEPRKSVLSRNKNRVSFLLNQPADDEDQMSTLKRNNRELADKLSSTERCLSTSEEHVTSLRRNINLHLPRVVIGNLNKMVGQLKFFLYIMQQTIEFCENPDSIAADMTILNPDLDISSTPIQKRSGQHKASSSSTGDSEERVGGCGSGRRSSAKVKRQVKTKKRSLTNDMVDTPGSSNSPDVIASDGLRKSRGVTRTTQTKRDIPDCSITLKRLPGYISVPSKEPDLDEMTGKSQSSHRDPSCSEEILEDIDWPAGNNSSSDSDFSYSENGLSKRKYTRRETPTRISPRRPRGKKSSSGQRPTRAGRSRTSRKDDSRSGSDADSSGSDEGFSQTKKCEVDVVPEVKPKRRAFPVLSVSSSESEEDVAPAHASNLTRKNIQRAQNSRKLEGVNGSHEKSINDDRKRLKRTASLVKPKESPLKKVVSRRSCSQTEKTYTESQSNDDSTSVSSSEHILEPKKSSSNGKRDKQADTSTIHPSRDVLETNNKDDNIPLGCDKADTERQDGGHRATKSFLKRKLDKNKSQEVGDQESGSVPSAKEPPQEEEERIDEEAPSTVSDAGKTTKENAASRKSSEQSNASKTDADSTANISPPTGPRITRSSAPVEKEQGEQSQSKRSQKSKVGTAKEQSANKKMKQ